MEILIFQPEKMFLIHHRSRVNMVVNLSAVVEVTMGQLLDFFDFKRLVEQVMEIVFVRKKLQSSPAVGSQLTV